MSNTPIDGHSDEFDELAGLYALHALQGDELARFEAHSADCERCRLMVRLDRETLARVALVAPAMDPSPDFKQRLMRRAAEELAASAASAPAVPVAPTAPAGPATLESAASEAVVRQALHERHDSDTAQPEPVEGPEPVQLRSRPGNLVPFWRRSPWLSALAAVFVVALVAAGAFTYENQTVAIYELTGSVTGTARVVVRRSGAAELDMSGVPNPEPGFIYEAWIIASGKPVAAGITATGDAKLPLSGDLRGTTIAITRERSRVDAPTSDPILAAVVQS